MYEFDNDYDEISFDQLSDEEADALASYESREYTEEDLECDELRVNNTEIKAAISKHKLEDYISRKGQPSSPEGTALEQYENININTRMSKTPSVEYNEETVDIDGRNITGTFPEFDSAKDVHLDDELRFASVSKQEKYCNSELQNEVSENSDKFKEIFSESQLEDIRSGKTPEGYTWHHHQDVGRMQLVEADIHKSNRHDGGFVLWGGEKR